jgi:N12 class adenine-specific DNA methylase
MEQLTGWTAGQLRRELGSLVYRNPEGGGWETADRYLSGNVRAKLATATAAAEIDSS